MPSTVKLLQVFNRYRERGGEEKSAERIYRHASECFAVEKLWWDSKDWDLHAGALGKLGQVRRMFCNEATASDLRLVIQKRRPDVILCHNLYPVGSPSVYREALDHGIPVVQYIHNFRPFSVGGTLWTGSEITRESLRGNYAREVMQGMWQGSVVKSALFAMMLKKLHASGWLDSIKLWIAISDFMRDRFIEAGVAEERIITLRHSWDALPEKPHVVDDGYYLFLGRLVPEKGIRMLLAAWELLRTHLGKQTPQLIIAGTGSEEEFVQNEVEKNEYVHYAGYVDGEEKERLISHCRAMVAPSVWWEPLGLVTYEAYDYCKPMLAAASGGLTETVQDNETGLLFEAGNVEALCEGVQKLQGMSTDAREEMGERGRKWLLENTEPDVWKNRFSNQIRQCLVTDS